MYVRKIIYYSGGQWEMVFRIKQVTVCSSKYYKQGVDSIVIDTKICKIWILKIVAKKSNYFKMIICN